MDRPNILILTPVKSASRYLDGYFALLERLTYPHGLLSLGLLESDSKDDTFARLEHLVAISCKDFRAKHLFKKDFGFEMPAGVPRYEAVYQATRRAVLARARNHLLFRALCDEDWVLWLDVDIVEFPADILQQLVALDLDIVHPHCVLDYGGRTFDLNAWSENGRAHMDHLRGRGRVRLQSVGGTMLLVRADRHRDGLVFRRFTGAAAAGSEIHTHCAAIRSGKSRRKALPSWLRIWALNVGAFPTLKFAIARAEATPAPGVSGD